jgi:hypothetical protein
MRNRVDLPVALGSLVFINVVFVSGAMFEEVSGSGTLVSPQVIFSCLHTFTPEKDGARLLKIEVFFNAQDFLKKQNVIEAALEILPKWIDAESDEGLNCTDREQHWRKSPLDFAVLTLDHPAP